LILAFAAATKAFVFVHIFVIFLEYRKLGQKQASCSDTYGRYRETRRYILV